MLGSAASPLAAQRGERNPERVMVATFQSADKELGVQAAEAIRNKLSREVNAKDVIVVPKADINNSLQSSGYSTTEALAIGDAKALASLVRAQQFVDGSVIRTPAGVKIDARLVLTRDPSRGQLFTSAEGAKLDDAAGQVAKQIKDARRQLAAEETCHNHFMQGKYQEAVAAARAGLTASPNGNIVAVCLGEGYSGLKMEDSVVAVAERIRARDPRNIMALRWLGEIYGTRKDPREIEILMQLLAADPTNTRLQLAVTNQLAASGQAAKAVPIIRDALQNNPGDPALMKTAWLVLLAAKDYEAAITVGNELIRVDTAAADTTYYSRLAGAYTALNQPQRVSETLARAVARYPGNAGLWVIYSDALRKAGQIQPALDAAKRALSINPAVPNGYVALVQAVSGLNQPEQVFTTLQDAATKGGDKAILSQVALQQADKAYKAGQTSKSKADYQRAVRFSQLSDQLAPSNDAKFLLGYNAFLVGQSSITEATERKNCELARTAREHFTLAEANLPAGGQKFPTEAAQLLAAIPQFTPAVNDAIKRLCR
ncbi:MAG TPA: tetratricopeptide repeat protein [Gemmatimonadaceae bacterium]|nr:tetratricopeptide repeat protein [Gemmatimonadaceae bacterium]